MNDVIALLAEANPVRVDDLAPLEHPNVARRPIRRRRLVAAAILATAVAGSLAGVFLVGGTTSHSTKSSHPRSNSGVTGPPGPTGGFSVAHPIYGKQVSLAQAAAAIGQPVVLPGTASIRPEDAGPVLAWSRGMRGIVAVTYPAEGLVVEYERPAPWADWSAGLTAYSHNFPHGRLTSLRGTPALVIPRKDDNIDWVGHKFGWVTFKINGLMVSVIGHYGEAVLESIAKSIIARSPSRAPRPGLNLLPSFPPRKPFSLRTASRRLGVAIPLPGLRLLKRSTAAEGWAMGTCPPSGRRVCMIWIPFPGESVSLVYQRPAPRWLRTRRQYEIEAKHMNKNRHEAEVLDLDGVPALAINENIAGQHNPGSISFVVGGTRVVVAGKRHTAVLRAIAQSIVERSK